jgi:regulatory protein YycI of two-component signal transduction system YycFG
MKAIITGSNIVQQNTIIVSNLTLGKVALNHTNIKQNKQVFRPKIIDCKFKYVSFMNNSGQLYPPRNSIAVTHESNRIEEYSARK